MPASLVLSPNITTSLEHALGGLAAGRREDPLSPTQFLLPTTEAVRFVQCRLPDSLGIRLYQFYSLAEAILDHAALPVHRLGEAALRRLIQRLLAELEAQGELTTFLPVIEKPGFVQVVIEWLREMKTQGIPPEDVSAEAARSGKARDRQLAALYLRYQGFLRAGDYSDADGLLWLAAEALEGDPALFSAAGPCAVLGFDQINPIQGRLIQALSRRCPDFTIYLPWDPARPEGSLALTRMASTRSLLERLLSPEIRTIDDSSRPAPALARLHAGLFEPGVPAVPLEDPPAVRAVAAPSREAEARQALRAVKRLLLEGVSPEEIGLLAPHPEAYRRLVGTTAEEFGLPVALDEVLVAQPVVAALRNLLSLPFDFAWRQTMDALRSPYVQQPWLTAEQIDLLGQLSRERPVIAGREQWAFALRPLELVVSDAEDEDLGPPPLVAQLDPGELIAIQEGLFAFFEALSPPRRAAYREYALWLQERLLGLFDEPEGEGEGAPEHVPGLDLLATCRQGAHAGRDLRALALAAQALRELVEAADLVPAGEESILWEAFRAELFAALASQSLPAGRDEGGGLRAGVRFGALEIGRAVAYEHVFVLGLAEGEFPRQAAPDVFYAPAERREHPLPLVQRDPAEEASLWWQVLGNCWASLALSHPRLDESGAPWLPSPYWQAVLEVFTDVEVQSLPVSGRLEPEQAASAAELLISLVQAGARSVPPELEMGWRAARRSQAVSSQRQGHRPAGVYEGYFRAADLRAELAQVYGPDHGWSVSRLNRYGNCPYGFFAQAILGLEARPDPSEGLDPMQRGSLLHALLEALGNRLVEEQLVLDAAHQPQVLAQVEAVCAQVFPTAPQRYGFRPNPLWRHEQEELRRQVEALVAWECEGQVEAARFQPYRQELRFGLGGALPRLSLEDGAGTEFQIHGVIDRLDRDQSGDLRVIDYKSGATKYSRGDIQKGLALQSALYALAAERLLEPEAQVVESYYLHIPLREHSGRLEFAGGAQRDEQVREAVEVAGAFVRAVRAGVFPSAPGKPEYGGRACSSFCDFAGLCRVSRQSLRKARQGGLV